LNVIPVEKENSLAKVFLINSVDTQSGKSLQNVLSFKKTLLMDFIEVHERISCCCCFCRNYKKLSARKSFIYGMLSPSRGRERKSVAERHAELGNNSLSFVVVIVASCSHLLLLAKVFITINMA